MNRESNNSTFLHGMCSDINELTPIDGTYTSALNATLITGNGNENIMLNDMGNAKVETAKLPHGYVPIGTCLFGGIIYIVSHNPELNLCQIGAFPSPQRVMRDEELDIKYLAFDDFVAGKQIKFTSKLIQLTDYDLFPGDRFLIKIDDTEHNNLDNIKSTLTGIYNDVSPSGLHINGNPQKIRLQFVNIQENGNLIPILNFKWYEKEVGDKTYKYITLLDEDIPQDNRKDYMLSMYNVFDSLQSGKLGILAKLEVNNTFSCGYSFKTNVAKPKRKNNGDLNLKNGTIIYYDDGTNNGTPNSNDNNVKKEHRIQLILNWTDDIPLPEYRVNPTGFKVLISNKDTLDSESLDIYFMPNINTKQIIDVPSIVGMEDSVKYIPTKTNLLPERNGLVKDRGPYLPRTNKGNDNNYLLELNYEIPADNGLSFDKFSIKQGFISNNKPLIMNSSFDGLIYLTVIPEYWGDNNESESHKNSGYRCPQLARKFVIDPSKIGSGEINITDWKYMISGDDDNRYLELFFGFESYLAYEEVINDVYILLVPYKANRTLESCSFDDFTDANKLGIYNAGLYFKSKLVKDITSDYNPNAIYVAKITISFGETNQTKEFYRVIYPQGLTDELYFNPIVTRNQLSYTIRDFNDLYLSDVVSITVTDFNHVVNDNNLILPFISLEGSNDVNIDGTDIEDAMPGVDYYTISRFNFLHNGLNLKLSNISDNNSVSLTSGKIQVTLKENVNDSEFESNVENYPSNHKISFTLKSKFKLESGGVQSSPSFRKLSVWDTTRNEWPQNSNISIVRRKYDNEDYIQFINQQNGNSAPSNFSDSVKNGFKLDEFNQTYDVNTGTPNLNITNFSNVGNKTYDLRVIDLQDVDNEFLDINQRFVSILTTNNQYVVFKCNTDVNRLFKYDKHIDITKINSIKSQLYNLRNFTIIPIITDAVLSIKINSVALDKSITNFLYKKPIGDKAYGYDYNRISELVNKYVNINRPEALLIDNNGIKTKCDFNVINFAENQHKIYGWNEVQDEADSRQFDILSVTGTSIINSTSGAKLIIRDGQAIVDLCPNDTSESILISLDENHNKGIKFKCNNNTL